MVRVMALEFWYVFGLFLDHRPDSDNVPDLPTGYPLLACCRNYLVVVLVGLSTGNVKTKIIVCVL